MSVLEQIEPWLIAGNEPLAPATRQRLAIHLLDTVGAWIAGRATEEGARLARLKTTPRASPPLLTGQALDGIALACATTRLTEVDDIHMASCVTPGSVVVPTALVFATVQPRPPGRQTFAAALRAGYEAMTRFGAAIGGPRLVYQGLWPTYFTAPMGAAAVASRLLGLDAAQTADALGIALTMTSGAPGGPSPASPRWLLLGLAARAGCAAALAAAEGFASDRTLLDGDWMVRTHGIPCTTSMLTAAVGPEADALAGLSLKPYCAAKQCIAAIEAFRELLAQGVSPDEIAALRVSVPPAYAALIGHRHAATGRIPRITSAAYNIALAAYEPEALGNVSRPDRTSHPQLAALMERVEVVPDPELARYYPQRWPAKAEAKLVGGRTAVSVVVDAPGDPSRPLDSRGVREKFHRYADRSMGQAAAAQLADTCLAAMDSDQALAKLLDWVKA